MRSKIKVIANALPQVEGQRSAADKIETDV